MRVYGYVRVSTKGQAPGTSLDEQTAEILKKYPTAVIVREVASGASERLEFAKVCEQLENGDKANMFCAWKSNTPPTAITCRKATTPTQVATAQNIRG